VTDFARRSQAAFVGHAAEVIEPTAPDFAELFKANFAYLWHSLRRLGVHERDLEDLAHDVFVTVHRRLDTYDPSRPIRPWLFAFACRAASDYRRGAHQRAVLIDDPDAIRDESASVDSLAMAREELGLVARALDALDFDRRAIFVLCEIDGVSGPEAARTLEIPLNTAYSRLRLAREDFASALRRIDVDRVTHRGHE
jgi:RNA polymerase sigma-70 factor, ECF subfamily